MESSSLLQKQRSDSSTEVVGVTGGCGFLGQHLVQYLLNNSSYDIKILDVNESQYKKLPFSSSPRVCFCKGDISNYHDVAEALSGCYAVFHTAALVSPQADRVSHYSVNVVGTENVVKVCQRSNIRYLIYTSTASVVYNGDDIVHGDEQLPYASSPPDFYCETKILAEKHVLHSNDDHSVLTVALRPHMLFGEGDPHQFPQILATAKKSVSSRLVIGDGRNIVDFTYVENVAHAHWLALQQLIHQPGKCAGRAYFITNGEPASMWGTWQRFLDGMGVERKRRVPLPATLVMIVAYVVVFLSRLLRFKPFLTPFVVKNVSTHHFFSNRRAHTDLGYQPVVSLADGLKRTIQYFKQQSSKL